MSYNVQQDKFVFGITPAPSPLNTNPINWRAYINDTADEINVVDEKTNLLVGTIGGGSGSYRYQRLPKTTVSLLPYADTATARGAAYEAALVQVVNNYIFLENGNIAQIDDSFSHFNNGAIIYDCIDLQTTDVIDRYWVAFRPSDTDATILEKIGEVKQTDDYYNNGFDYTYQSQTNPNECKFIRFSAPINDSTNLFSIVTTITISGTSVGSTMTVTEVTNNFGGNTVLNLYNANAPAPIPGTPNWVYRSPYYTAQDGYNNMMNGVDEGWVWYGDGTTPSTLYTYMAGFNILTGATSFINPITSLAATTNLNPVAPVSVINFNSTLWESHPGGVVFFVGNNQVLDNGNNNNDVTGIFSPRWTNSKIVVFLNGRDFKDGQFTNTALDIDDNSVGFYNDFGFDGLHFVQYAGFNMTAQGSIFRMFRYALDVPAQQPVEISVTPMANPGYDSGFSYWEWNDAFMPGTYSTEYYLNNVTLINAAIWSKYEYFYWSVTSSKINQLQSNNNSDPLIKIANKFYTTYSDFNKTSVQFGIQYDEYKLA